MQVKGLTPEKLRRMEPNSSPSLREAFDRMFDEWFSSKELDLDAPRGDRSYLPRVDVTESEDAIQVSAELPGLEEADVEVLLTADYLTIKGDKRERKEEKHRGYYRSERTYGAFRRDITLPCEVQIDLARAYFKAGVLTVRLPKSPEAKQFTKKIPVQAG